MKPFNWLWLIPTTIITAALFTRAEHLVAVGIGLAAALSLSGSI
jgi:hypothetical protein